MPRLCLDGGEGHRLGSVTSRLASSSRRAKIEQDVMKRSLLIRLVAVMVVGLLALVVAIVAPFVGVFFWEMPDFAADVSEVGDTFDTLASNQATTNASMVVSLAAFGVTGICVIYVLVVVAGWFVGPAEKPRDE